MTTIMLVLFTLAGLGYLFWRWENSYLVRNIERIPGPSKWLFFGNIFDFPRDGRELLFKISVEWVQKYGHIYRTWRGLNPIVAVSSPIYAEAILSSHVNINKSEANDFFLPWLGDGLLLATGDKWRRDRRMLTPAFHVQLLGSSSFFEIFHQNAEIFAEQISKKLVVDNAREVDVYPMASYCALDIICETAMGIKIDAQRESGSQYIRDVALVEAMMQTRINSTLGLLPNWLYFKTPHGRQLQIYLDRVHDFTLKVLRDRENHINSSSNEDEHQQIEDDSSGNKKRRVFLELLLEAASKGADLSQSDIIKQVDTFMFAGHDTISAAITWFLYCMATHQDEQERVYLELMEVYGDSGRPCVVGDLSQLKYLDCCIKEAIRVHPSVPLLRRKVNEEMKLGEYTVPAGSSVSLLIYALHHDPELFPDPLSFKPERFLPEQSRGRHPFAFVPFGAGPRNCIGQKFAVYEEKVVLISLLRKFRFDIDPLRNPIRETFNVILKPENGMPLLITPRR